MKCYVYLNEGEDHFSGFKPEHMNSLELAAVLTQPDERSDVDALEAVYIVGNGMDPQSDVLWYCQDGRDNRSFSVGDVVVLDRGGEQRTWTCEPSGWNRLAGTPIRLVTVDSPTS